MGWYTQLIWLPVSTRSSSSPSRCLVWLRSCSMLRVACSIASSSARLNRTLGDCTRRAQPT